MTVNALAVYNKLEDGSYYFYNIGDIVEQDNVYVSSHMSKRRLMLGFYSILIFEKAGYTFIDDIIWDKGEVQSKRNSTENLFPGYIKPINCYEHILIFAKKKSSIKLKTRLIGLDTVKKINSKGENKLGHTAPYPEALVKLIFDYIDKSGYLLDPFLGSGTTVIASLKNNIKSVGVELNDNYYNLALDRIKNSTAMLDLF
jgi:DNA modification methylase